MLERAWNSLETNQFGTNEFIEWCRLVKTEPLLGFNLGTGGPWQMGRLTAREYGRKARDAARQMRVIDPTVQLIACGSSNTIPPTYLVWDREVLTFDRPEAAIPRALETPRVGARMTLKRPARSYSVVQLAAS